MSTDKDENKDDTANDIAFVENREAEEVDTDTAAVDTEANGTDDKSVEHDDKQGEFDPGAWYGEGDERNDTADSVFELLHEGGVDVDTAKALLYDAVRDGKPENIDRDALVEKVGKARAALILAGIKSFIAERSAAEAAAVAAVHEAAGGKEAWETVLPWAKQNIPADEIAEFAAMINKGGKQAQLAAQEIVRRHNADPKTKSVGRVAVEGDRRGPAKQDEGISREEYGRRLIALTRQNKATPEALAALRAARKVGKQRGK